MKTLHLAFSLLLFSITGTAFAESAGHAAAAGSFVPVGAAAAAGRAAGAAAGSEIGSAGHVFKDSDPGTTACDEIVLQAQADKLGWTYEKTLAQFSLNGAQSIQMTVAEYDTAFNKCDHADRDYFGAVGE